MGLFSIFKKKKNKEQEEKAALKSKEALNEIKAEPKEEANRDEKKNEEVKNTAPAPNSCEKSKAESRPKTEKKAEPKEDKKEEEKLEDVELKVAEIDAKTARSGKFEIKKTKDNRFVFNLYASNHVIVATSQIYSTSAAAVNGINSIIKNAPVAPLEDQTVKGYATLPYPKWEIYKDNGGQFRFRLNATNGSCIVHSQGYTAKTNCKNGIESIIKTAKGAEIVKAYLKKD